MTKPRLPVVSDHALVRWLERVHGIDMEFYRQKLAEEVGPVAGVGDMAITRSGIKFLVRDDTLITVVDNPQYQWSKKSKLVA